MKKSQTILLNKSLLILLFQIIGFWSLGQQAIPENPYSLSLNYVRSWDAVKPDSNKTIFTLSNTLQTSKIITQYVDGLGRPVQTVVKQGSLVTNGSGIDLVSAVLYDGFGRESNKYLPFAANTAAGNTSVNDGIYKLNSFHQQSSFSTNQYS